MGDVDRTGKIDRSRYATALQSQMVYLTMVHPDNKENNIPESVDVSNVLAPPDMNKNPIDSEAPK